jgi:chitodextrinase
MISGKVVYWSGRVTGVSRAIQGWAAVVAPCVAAIVSLGAVLTLAPAASAILMRTPTGHVLGVQFRRGVNPRAVPDLAVAAAAAGSTDNGNLQYEGGPVLHSSDPYLIFWDPNSQIGPTSRSVMERYLTDVAGASSEPTDTYGVLRQYGDSSGFAAAAETFVAANQAISDSYPYPHLDTVNCATPSGDITTCITDAQIQAEITRLIAVDGLPTGDGDNAPVYFVVIPPTVNVCKGPGDCAQGQFCSYHTSFMDGGNPVLYAAIPMLPVAATTKGCQSDGTADFQAPNGDIADNVVDDMSHEYAETITDPLIGESIYSWIDPADGQEVADNCESYGTTVAPAEGLNPNAYMPVLGGRATGGPPLNGGTTSGNLYDQLIGGERYYTQTVWSDGDVAAGGCEAQPPAGELAPSFMVNGPTTPITTGEIVAFDPNASFSASAFSSSTWDFGDGEGVFIQGSAPIVTHSYSRPGTYIATLTLVDGHGNVATTTRQVVVDQPPAAAFSSSLSSVTAGTPVSFNAGASSDPDPGGAITSYSWTFGDRSPSASGVRQTHTYKSAGSYTVTLTVIGRSGLTASTSRTLKVIKASTITKVSVKGRYVLVTVDGPGTVRVGARRFTAAKAKTLKIPISLTTAQKRSLAQRHTLTLTLRLTFVPVRGPSDQDSRRITLHDDGSGTLSG